MKPSALVVGAEYLICTQVPSHAERQGRVTVTVTRAAQRLVVTYCADGRFHAEERDGSHLAPPSFALPEVKHIFRIPQELA